MTLALLLALFPAAQDSLEDLLRRLEDSDVAVREEATQKLMARDLSELPALEAALRAAREPEPQARLRRAVARVRRHRHAKLIQELAASPAERDQEAARSLAALDAGRVRRILRNRGGGDVDRILAALLDLFREDEEVFRGVLRDHPASLPSEFAARAVPYLSDADPALCGAAIRSLSRFRDVKAVTPGVDWADAASRVARVAAEEGHPIRLEALQALPLLGDASSLPTVLKSLKGADEAEQLAGLRTLRAFLERHPALAPNARAAEPLLDSKSPDARRLAYEALAAAPKPEDAERVRRALREEEPRARWGALELAAALKDPSIASAVAALLPEKDGPKAAEVLFRLSPARAADHLEAVLRHQLDLADDWFEYVKRYAAPEEAQALRMALGPVLAAAEPARRKKLLWSAWRLDAKFDAEVLAPLIRDPDPEIRKDALGRVGSARTEAGVEALRGSLHHPESEVRDRALDAVREAKAAACAPAVADLLEREPELRGEALRTLAELGDRRVLPRVRPFLIPGKEARHAIEAVEALGAEEEGALLLRFAQEMTGKDDPRDRAVAAAAKLLGGKAIGTLRPLIEDRRIRGAVLSALSGLQAAECAPEAARYLSESDSATVRAAARLMGEARHAEAIPDLVRLLEHRDVAWEAAGALTRMPAREVAPRIAKHLTGDSRDLRRAAVRILNELDADEIVEHLDSILSDRDPAIARAGIATVRRRRIASKLEAVERHSQGSDARLAKEAIAALAELDWAGRRAGLLQRLDDPHGTEIALLFARRNDPAPIPALVSNGGYDALVALNAFRKPGAYERAARPSLRGLGVSSFESQVERARDLSRETGFRIDLEIALPPFPRASFEDAFGSGRWGRFGSAGGGGRYGGGDYSLLDKAAAYFGKEHLPIVEDDAVRIVPQEEALRFWRDWAAHRK